jgi:CubicO group peptidase (beta-lactamase class C family)
MAREKVPGLSVALARDGQVVWRKAYGFADLEGQVPAGLATLFRIGSISKAITAVAVLRAVDTGRIDLDADVQHYVPAFPAKTSAILVRQLLTGTGGIRGYIGDEYLRNLHFSSLAASLSLFRDDTLAYVPGTSYIETPYGFTLLGLALEFVAHASYEEYVTREVLRPAHMAATRVDGFTPIMPNRARLYTRDSLGHIRNADPIDVSYKVPAGGWISTAADVARLGVALMDGSLMSQSGNAAMRAPVRLTDGTQLPLGMGVALGTVGGRLPGTKDAVWASGLIQGGIAVLLMYPHDRIAVALLMNVNGEVGAESFRLLTQTTFLADSTAIRLRRLRMPRKP